MISDILLKYEPDKDLLKSFDKIGCHILGVSSMSGGSKEKQEESKKESVINSERSDDSSDDTQSDFDPTTANTILSSDSPGGTILKAMDNVAKGFVDGSSRGFSDAVKTVTGDLPEQKWEEVAPEFRTTLKNRSKFVSNILNDPDSRKALTDLLEEYARGLAEVHEISKPAMDEVLLLFWETVAEMGEKSAVGAINTSLNIGKAAVAEIPVVGGVVDLTLALASAFNYFAATVSPMISKGAKMGYTVSKEGEKTASVIDKVKKKANVAMEKVKTAFEKAQEKADKLKAGVSEIANKNPLSGGKKKKKRAKRTMKRIKNTLSRFTRRRKNKSKRNKNKNKNKNKKH